MPTLKDIATPQMHVEVHTYLFEVRSQLFKLERLVTEDIADMDDIEFLSQSLMLASQNIHHFIQDRVTTWYEIQKEEGNE